MWGDAIYPSMYRVHEDLLKYGVHEFLLPGAQLHSYRQRAVAGMSRLDEELRGALDEPGTVPVNTIARWQGL